MKQFLFRLSTKSPILLSLISSFVITSVAHADSSIPSIMQGGSISTLGTNLFCPIQTYMFWILISLSVIMIMWAAYLFVTAKDDEEQVSEAKKSMFYAALGIVAGLLARAFPLVIASIFPNGTQGVQGC